MALKFDKTDPVHNALKEGLAQLLKRYFAEVVDARDARDRDKPRRRTATKAASKSRTHGGMSKAGREAIGRAARKRWAKWRKEQKAKAAKRTAS